MTFNCFSNIRTIYYNTIVIFYLVFNTIFPIYDDAIITFQKYSTTSLLFDKKTSYKNIKRYRLYNFINSLENIDKIVINDDNSITLIEKNNSSSLNTDTDNTSTDSNDNHTSSVELYDNDISYVDSNDENNDHEKND
jgi:hypothetical protein